MPAFTATGGRAGRPLGQPEPERSGVQQARVGLEERRSGRAPALPPTCGPQGRRPAGLPPAL
ncbi:MAG: hypothetical protein VKI42_00695, partial [Synechococcaceae cyanobacterium]|nr:hypothetical protein [Synechococcaceae cyanobacterium]